MDAHVLKILHGSSHIEVLDVDAHVFCVFLAREMVLMICIFTFRRETAGELGFPG